MSKTYRLKTTFSICLLVLFLFAHSLQAENPNKIFGEVHIESTEIDKSNEYSTQQDQALQYVKKVEGSLKNKDSVGNTTPSEAAIFYLTGLYLYCSAKTGACPFILDTIMAGEYLNDKANNKKSCGNMKHFWELWIKNGFEKRLPYLVTIGSTPALKRFNDLERSRYIKCDATIANFQLDEQIARSIELSVKLIEQVKQKNLNVFQETGAFKVEVEEKKN